VDLPDGYGFRSPTPDDLDAVAAVLIADQQADGSEAVLDRDVVHRTWSRPAFDLTDGAWVVTGPSGDIVAYGHTQPEEDASVGSWGVVHPEHRGIGIGSALFAVIEARATALLSGAPSGRFRHSITAGDAVAAALVRGRGLRPIRHYWHMWIDLDGRVDVGDVPEGIQIRTVDPTRDDLRAVHAILEAGFMEDPGDHPETFERWVEEDASGPGFDPGLWLLTHEDGRPVATLAASRGGAGGWVDWLAVLPSHRGRGIGSSLLRHAFASFTDRGVRQVQLNVDAENVTGATAIYERAGMRVANRWDLWERIGPPPGD
jgi:mycothiol synthase